MNKTQKLLWESVAVCGTMFAVSLCLTFYFTLHWMNLNHMCNNSLTYPVNMDQCNTYFHHSGIFNGITIPFLVLSAVGLVFSGIGLAIQYVERKEKGSK